MRLLKLYGIIFSGIYMMFCSVSASCVYAENIAGMWELHVEVVKGARKGEKSSYTVEITQDEDGRVEGKTLDQVNNQVGRLSGLVKRTKIEMTFSADKDKYISDLNISPQGTFIGGIFHRPDGNEGIIYGLKQDAPSLEGTF